MRIKIDNLTAIVKENFVEFSRYRKGYLYYKVANNGEVYEFPILISDTGDANFEETDKAILFMRYIRKSIDDGTFRKILS